MATQLITPILFVCEGESDEAFLGELIKKRRLSGFGVWCIDPKAEPPDPTGVGGFGKRLEGLLAKTGIEACRLVIVVADNDDQPQKKFRDVIKQIRKPRWFGVPEQQRQIAKPRSVPPNRHVPDLMVMMLPWDEIHGALETLCYEAGAAIRPKLAKCIDAFIKCAKLNEWPIAKVSKIRARCMLATLCPKNPEISFKWSWTTGKRGPSEKPWPVNRKEFNRIVKYLRALSKDVLPRG